MTQPILAVKDVSFAYPAKAGAEGFSLAVERLEVQPGERLALIGPNGAGKTTLLHVIACLQSARSGVIIFNGQEITGKEQILSYHRATAFVPQKTVVYHGSVADNVGLGLVIRGVKPAERTERAAAILNILKISHLTDRPARQISGGEARRLMLARALVLNPQVLFLDEPFGDLDGPVKRNLIEDLLPLLSRGGMTTIFVTHNQEETYQLADRVVVLLRGRVVQSGSGAEVFANPANPDVAEFLGIRNILPGRLIKRPDASGYGALRIGTSEREDGMMVVTLSTGAGSPAPQLWGYGDNLNTPEVVACIPPEAIVLVTETSPQVHTSSRNLLSGVVREVMPGRHFAWVKVDCGVLLTAAVTNESVQELGLTAGKSVRLMIKATAVRLLER